MFWGLSMEPQKRYTQTVTESFHISQAAIDVSSLGQESAPTQIILEYENADYILATLSKSSKIYQVPLDLNFQKGDHVSFRTAGPAIVHLSGYHILEDDDDLAQRLMGGSDDDTDEEIENDGAENSVSDELSSVQSGIKRKKATSSAGNEKKSKLDFDSDDDTLGTTLGESESDEDDDDDEEDDDDEDEDDDDDDGDDEEDEEEEDEEEEETVVTKKGKKNTSVNGITDKKSKLNSSKNESPKTPKLGQQLNKSKQEKTPKQDGKLTKQEKTPKQDGKTPKQEKTPKAVAVKPATPGQKKVLEGGIISEDLKVGDGPTAKSGKMAAVYYAGRLKSNGKQFDSATSGPGFKFRIGRGEVIKGWDIGVAGMRVGGRRRLTIPAEHGYGAKGAPPSIPPNASLVFDIELRGLS